MIMGLRDAGRVTGKSGFSEQEIITIVVESLVRAQTSDQSRRLGISENTFCLGARGGR